MHLVRRSSVSAWFASLGLIIELFAAVPSAEATPGLAAGYCRNSGYACVDGGYAATAPSTGNNWAWRYYGEQGAGGIGTPTGPHNCTLYVAWRLQQNGLADPMRAWGYAGQWGATLGYDHTPTVGSVAWWAGNPGHVAYVEQVSGNRVFVRADNYVSSGGYTDSGFVQSDSVSGFLHPLDVAGAVSPYRLVDVDGYGGSDLVLRRGNQWFVDLGANGTVDRSFYFGAPGDQAFIGNIDGTGGADILLRRVNQWFVDLGANGTADRTFQFGAPGDEAFLTNVDNSGGSDLILRRGNQWFVDLGVNGRTPDRSFQFGNPGDQAFIGNIDGTGWQDILLRRGNQTFADLGSNGSTDRSFQFGAAGDQAFLTNSDNYGGDDLVLRRGNQWFVDLGADGGNADRSFQFGNPGDQAFIGNIDGTGWQDILLRRGNETFVDLGSNGSTNRSFRFGADDDQVITR